MQSITLQLRFSGKILNRPTKQTNFSPLRFGMGYEPTYLLERLFNGNYTLPPIPTADKLISDEKIQRALTDAFKPLHLFLKEPGQRVSRQFLIFKEWIKPLPFPWRESDDLCTFIETLREPEKLMGPGMGWNYSQHIEERISRLIALVADAKVIKAFRFPQAEKLRAHIRKFAASIIKIKKELVNHRLDIPTGIFGALDDLQQRIPTKA